MEDSVGTALTPLQVEGAEPFFSLRASEGLVSAGERRYVAPPELTGRKVIARY